MKYEVKRGDHVISLEIPDELLGYSQDELARVNEAIEGVIEWMRFLVECPLSFGPPSDEVLRMYEIISGRLRSFILEIAWELEQLEQEGVVQLPKLSKQELVEMYTRYSWLTWFNGPENLIVPTD